MVMCYTVIVDQLLVGVEGKEKLERERELTGRKISLKMMDEKFCTNK